MRLSFAFASSLLVGAGVAAAQPAPPPPTDTGNTPPPPTVDVAPPPPPPTPPPPPPKPAEEPTPLRPEGLAIGIGFGYEFKTSLETPNVFSARLRLPSGVILEPTLVLNNADSHMETMGAPTVSTTDTEIGAGALVRYPIVSHGHFDLEAVASALLDYKHHVPDTPDSDTKTTTLSIGWGLAVDYWITHHWALSLTASNPLVDIASTTTATGPNMSDKMSSTSYGLVFDPTVALMIHLFN